MDIETLIRPLLTKVCEYCSFKRCGYEIPQDLMLRELHTELSAIEQRCTALPILQQQYAAVEKALIFFIDYTIKEGNFSYSPSYRELARDFNEFSGDDKFFDLLDDAFKNSNDPAVLRVFYLMMGLGFDGFHKRNRPEIVEVMRTCRGHLPELPDLRRECVTPVKLAAPDELKAPRRPFWQRQRWWLMVLMVVAGLSVCANWYALNRSTAEFENAVEVAVRAAAPYSVKQQSGDEDADDAEGADGAGGRNLVSAPRNSASGSTGR